MAGAGAAAVAAAAGRGAGGGGGGREGEREGGCEREQGTTEMPRKESGTLVRKALKRLSMKRRLSSRRWRYGEDGGEEEDEEDEDEEDSDDDDDEDEMAKGDDEVKRKGILKGPVTV